MRRIFPSVVEIRRQWRALTRCPGLKPGWFLSSDVETWYARRACGARMSFVRGTWVGVCWRCSAAFGRRGFRVNYEDLAREVSRG